MTKQKALILSAKAGGGHTALAKALQAHLELWGYDTTHLELLGSSMENVYKLQDKLGIYEATYKLTNNRPASRTMVKLYEKRVEQELERLVPGYSTKFDFVFSTYFILHPKGGKNRIVYIPDPLYHHGWCVSPHMNFYFNAWAEGSEEMEQKAPQLKNQIRTVGLIRHPIFYDYAKKILMEASYKSKIKRELGYENKKVILVTGGGIFIRKSVQYLHAIAQRINNDPTIQVLVLCGSDVTFRREAQNQYKATENLQFKGWLTSDEMANYMCAADSTFAFSTAQTAIESTMLGTPCLIFDYIKGQETAYVKLLTKNKVAIELEGTVNTKVDEAFKLVSSENPWFEFTEWQKKLIAVPETLKQALDDIKLQAS